MKFKKAATTFTRGRGLSFCEQKRSITAAISVRFKTTTIDWGQVYLGQNVPFGDSPGTDQNDLLGTVPIWIILDDWGLSPIDRQSDRCPYRNAIRLIGWTLLIHWNGQ